MTDREKTSTGKTNGRQRRDPGTEETAASDAAANRYLTGNNRSNKKDSGVNLTALKNREKAAVVDALKDRYSLQERLQGLKISKSSYYYQESVFQKLDKYQKLRENKRTCTRKTNNVMDTGVSISCFCSMVRRYRKKQSAGS